MRTINKVVLHAAYTKPSMNIGVKEIDEWHRAPPRNWSQIGYHYVIRRNGIIEEGRPIAIAGAHARGHNLHSIGICLVGGMTEDTEQPTDNFTEDQYTALSILLDDLVDDFGEMPIVGHYELDSKKECPCFDVAEWLMNR